MHATHVFAVTLALAGTACAHAAADTSSEPPALPGAEPSLASVDTTAPPAPASATEDVDLSEYLTGEDPEEDTDLVGDIDADEDGDELEIDDEED